MSKKSHKNQGRPNGAVTVQEAGTEESAQESSETTAEEGTTFTEPANQSITEALGNEDDSVEEQKDFKFFGVSRDDDDDIDTTDDEDSATDDDANSETENVRILLVLQYSDGYRSGKLTLPEEGGLINQLFGKINADYDCDGLVREDLICALEQLMLNQGEELQPEEPADAYYGYCFTRQDDLEDVDYLITLRVETPEEDE